MSAETHDRDPMLTRRGALKLGAGAGAAALGLSGAVPDSIEPVEDAEAGLLLTGAIGLGGAMATRWALKEIDAWPGDEPADGIGADTLSQMAHDAQKKRESRTKSMFMDNENIINYMDEPTFSEGKLAALEAIKDGKTKTEATDAGKEAAQDHMATIESNFVKSFDEMIKELYNYHAAADNSEDTQGHVDRYYDGNWNDSHYPETTFTVVLRDGSELEYSAPAFNGDEDDPVDFQNSDRGLNIGLRLENTDGVKSWYDTDENWRPQWTAMQDKFDDVISNIELWVDNVYDKVQTGEVSPSDYLSATDLANTIAEDDSKALAIADLISMNIPGDYGTPTTIELEDGTKLEGYLAATDPGSSTLTEGTTIDPEEDSGSWYIAYLPSTAIEPIDSSQYNESYGIQSGKFRLWTDPLNKSDGTQYDNVSYVVETTDNESAYVAPDEFNQTTNSSDDTIWEGNISDDLDQVITEIGQIRRVNDGTPDEYRTLNIDQPFEILSIDGADSVDIQEQREPQEDDNYITESEWEEISDQQEELIEKYEEADSGGGAVIDGDLFGDVSVPSLGPIDTVGEWIVVGVGTVIGSIVLGNLSN